MHTWEVIGSAWRANGTVLAGCGILFAFYFILNRFRFSTALAWFAAGDLMLAAILCSPLELLARNYLFTAEATERLFLFFTVPYLLIRGLNEKLGVRLRLDRIALPYRAAWIAGMAVLSIWFVPSCLNPALQSGGMRVLELCTTLVGGAIFWWPLHSPIPKQRVRPVPTALFYLAAATIWCSLLGLFLTFEQPWYFPRYSNTLDVLHVTNSLRTQWNFGREADQETAGLFFWIGALTVLLCEVMFTYYRWYITEAKNSRE